MSQENVDRFLEAPKPSTRLSTGATSSVRWKTFHPGAVLELQNAALEGDRIGHDGLRRFFAEFAEVFELFILDYPDVRDLGDQVLDWGRPARSGEAAGSRASFR